MSKKTRSEKEIARLRRDLELLRSRLKYQEGPGEVRKESKTSVIQDRTLKPPEVKVVRKSAADLSSLAVHDFSHLKKDLFRTGLLSLLSLSIIFAVYGIQTLFPATINLILRP